MANWRDYAYKNSSSSKSDWRSSVYGEKEANKIKQERDKKHLEAQKAFQERDRLDKEQREKEAQKRVSLPTLNTETTKNVTTPAIDDEYTKILAMKNPVFRTIAKGAYKFNQTGVGKFMDRLTDTMADTATYGTQDYLQNKGDTGNGVANTIADIVGMGFGMAVNPSGMAGSTNKILSPVGNVVEKGTTKALNNVAPKYLTNPSVYNAVTKITPAMARGATEFATQGALMDYGRGTELSEGIKNVGPNALSGAVFGGALKGAGMALPKIKNSVIKETTTRDGINFYNPSGKLKPKTILDEVATTNKDIVSGQKQIKVPKVKYKINDEIVLNDNGTINGGILTKTNKNGTYEIKLETNRGIEYRTVKPGPNDTFETVISKTKDLPIAERNFDNVGNKKVKAYQYNHPELKADIQAEANILKGELERGFKPLKGSNYVNGERVNISTERIVSPHIAAIKDNTKASYDDINKALNNIIKDNGAENNALSKKIEIIIDDRLSNGYADDVLGMDIPANQNYVSMKSAIEGQRQPFKINLQNNSLKSPEVKPSGDLNTRRLTNTVKNSEWASDELKTGLDDMNYDIKHNEDVLNLARKRVEEDFEGSMALVKSKAKPTAESNTIALELVRKLQNEGKINEAIDIVEIVTEKATSQGQAIQALSIWKRLTPEGMLKYAQRQVNKINAEVLEKNPKATKVKLTPEEGKTIVDKMKALETTTGERGQQIIMAEVANIINAKIPPTASDKLRALQRISMLLNPKTMVRNTLGNTIMGATEGIKDIPGTLADIAISKLKTGKRTTTLPIVGLKEYAKGFKTGVANTIDDAKRGVDTSLSSGQFEVNGNVEAFKNPILKKLDRETTIGLQLGDRPFYHGVREQYIKQQLKLNNLKEPTQEIIEQADKLAQERTFQNASKLVESFNKARNALNDFGSKLGLGNENFGLGNIVIPFSKTPANILDKAIDYSPAGLIKIAKLIKDPKLDQKALSDTIGRTVTGTAAIMLGYDLAKKGLITGGLDKDKDVADMQRQMGKSAYSFKSGDTYRTFDWAMPTAMPLAIGADIYQQGKDRKEASSIVYEAIKSGGQTLFNLSVMQGLNRFMGGYSPVENLTETILNAPNQLIPTVLKQGIQLNDSTARSTYDPSMLTQALNISKSKIPYANKNLEPKINTLGEETKLYQGNNSPFNVLINPGFTTKEQSGDIQNKVIDLYNTTNEKVHFPRVAPRTITDENGKTVELTPKEITDYQKKLGEETKKLYNENLQSTNNGYKYTRTMSAVPKELKDKYQVVKRGEKNYTVVITENADIVSAISNDITKINQSIKAEILNKRSK